jgi:branched-chain amino acid transport system substrate-binding protein
MTLIAIIVVAAVGGAAYVLLDGEEQSSETIKIGLLTDMGSAAGEDAWKGAFLAAEQLNVEGGILGRKVEVVRESKSSNDPTEVNSALVRLLSQHKVDFIIGGAGQQGLMVQEVVAEFKRIFIDFASQRNIYSQRVLDDYDIGKYYFRVLGNESSVAPETTFLHLRELTGFNRVGFITTDLPAWKDKLDELEVVLPEQGFDIVYREHFPLGTFDFTSYFARAEQAEVEIMYALVFGNDGIYFAKEYHERQSPMVIYGFLGGMEGTDGWEITGGSCEYISLAFLPFVAGYPLTSKTIPDREAYIDRWGEVPSLASANVYNTLRYILSDAIERAETTATEAVIEALEKTRIETTDARNFVFTSSHDVMMSKDPNDTEYKTVLSFQWVDEKLVPIAPKAIMEEAGTSYTFPDWFGPWDDL